MLAWLSFMLRVAANAFTDARSRWRRRQLKFIFSLKRSHQSLARSLNV
jgi:hypothetical protein